MSVDVAFESEEEISRKLSRYEQLFRNRYTDADPGYRRCVANAEKVGQVPVIDPWPPRGVFSRRGGGGRGRYNKHDDWDSGGGGGGRRRGPRGRRRDNRYHRDPYPRYDRPPPPGHWGHGSRSPRDRSPHRPLSPHPHHYHRHGSSSPLPHPPPSHPHHLSPHSHHPHHHRSSHSRSISPAHPHTRSPPHRSPLKDRDSESASGHEAPPTVPHLLNLDLQRRDERIPSESDVKDILSSAHHAPLNQVTAENLRQAKMERKTHRSKHQDTSRTGKKLASSRHSDKDQDSTAPPSGHGLVITHGKTEVVSTSYLLGHQDEEEGSGKGPPQKKTKKSKLKRGGDRFEFDEGTTAGGVRGSGESRGSGEGLVMRLDKKFCHSNSDSSILSHSVPNTPSSDLTPTFPKHAPLSQPHSRDLKVVSSKPQSAGLAPPHHHGTTAFSSLPSSPTSPTPLTASPLDATTAKEKKKKKKKKKKKRSGDTEEVGGHGQDNMVTVAPLKLKITLGKSPKSLES